MPTASDPHGSGEVSAGECGGEGGGEAGMGTVSVAEDAGRIHAIALARHSVPSVNLLACHPSSTTTCP